MSDDPETGEKIGYRNPPRASRFKKGQSGNPRGRPKGAKNFATLFDEELSAKVSITENGKRKTITKGQAVVKQLVNKAASGDAKAIPLLLQHQRAREAAEAITVRSDVQHNPHTDLVIKRLFERIRGSTPTGAAAAGAQGEATPPVCDQAEEGDAPC